jgi:signal-transduction protein with cAMP-binding, CBS, and nucleotidyltransferase domain
MKNSYSKLTDIHAKAYLESVIISIDNKISEINLHKILNVFKLQKIEKNVKIINEGEITNHLYFIFKGLVRVYYHKSGKELIDWFAEEGHFFWKFIQLYFTKTRF